MKRQFKHNNIQLPTFDSSQKNSYFYFTIYTEHSYLSVEWKMLCTTRILYTSYSYSLKYIYLTTPIPIWLYLLCLCTTLSGAVSNRNTSLYLFASKIGNVKTILWFHSNYISTVPEYSSVRQINGNYSQRPIPPPKKFISTPFRKFKHVHDLYTRSYIYKI